MLLAQFGAMVKRPYVMAGRSRHPARLNAVIVGKTLRARKGTAAVEVSSVIEKADPDFAVDRVVSGLASGEGLIAHLANDERGDVGLVVLEPEFARVLKVCAREGSTLSAVLREAWDKDHLRVMTRR